MFCTSAVHRVALTFREGMRFKIPPRYFLYKIYCLPCLFWKGGRKQIPDLNETKQVILVSRAIPQSSPIVSSTFTCCTVNFDNFQGLHWTEQLRASAKNFSRQEISSGQQVVLVSQNLANIKFLNTISSGSPKMIYSSLLSHKVLPHKPTQDHCPAKPTWIT